MEVWRFAVIRSCGELSTGTGETVDCNTVGLRASAVSTRAICKMHRRHTGGRLVHDRYLC